MFFRTVIDIGCGMLLETDGWKQMAGVARFTICDISNRQIHSRGTAKANCVWNWVTTTTHTQAYTRFLGDLRCSGFPGSLYFQEEYTS